MVSIYLVCLTSVKSLHATDSRGLSPVECLSHIQFTCFQNAQSYGRAQVDVKSEYEYKYCSGNSTPLQEMLHKSHASPRMDQ